MKPTRTGTVLLLIVLLGILLRILWLDYARPEPVSDYRFYLQQAERLLDRDAYVNRGGKTTAFLLPGTPVFLALLLLLSRDLFWLSLGSLALSGALPIPVYFLTRNISGGRRATGLWAAALAAFYPPFIFYSPVLASEHLETLLVFGALAVLTASHSTRLGVIGAGALLAGANLSRGSALAFFPAAVFCLLGQPGYLLRRRLGRLGIFLAAAVLPLGGWWLRNRLLLGPGVGLSTVGGINFYQAHNPDLFGWRAGLKGCPLYDLKTEAEQSREGYRLGFEYIRSRPSAFFTKIPVSTALLYQPPHYAWRWATRTGAARPPWGEKPLSLLPVIAITTLWSHYLLLSLAGLSVLIWRKIPRRGLITILLLLLAHWFLYTVIFYGAPRYGYFAASALIPLAALIPGFLSQTRGGAPNPARS